MAETRSRAWLLPTLHAYRPAWLRADVLAGVAAGTVVVPQAMAYATVAGLPVEVGLYTCMVPMLVYAALGGSHSLSMSTTSTIAVLTAAALAVLPSDRSPDEMLRDAFTLTALVGVVLLLMRLFRLGSLVEQISPATMTGVKTGVGLTVAATQLPTLLGVEAPAGDDGFFGTVEHVLAEAGDTSATTVCVAVASIVVLLALRRFAPRVPGPLVVVGGSIALVALTDVEERGLALVGAVSSGLPSPTLPVWEHVLPLVPGACAIAIVAFMETVVVARSQRQRSEPTIDSDRELLANGVAALAGGFAQSMPPAGGFSQSAVNQGSGARSQLSGVTTAALAVVVALLLGPVLGDLPEAVLAAMVMVAVLGLVAPSDFVRLGRVDPVELWVAVVTTVIGLTAGLIFAVGVGVALTLLLVLRAINRSRARPLHPLVGGGWTVNAEIRDDEAEQAYADLLLLRLEGPLYTGNARPTQDAVLASALDREPRPAAVVLQLAAVDQVTVPLLDVLEALDADLAQEDILLVLASLPATSRKVAGSERWFAGLEADGRVQLTVDAAVARARGDH